ncbi:NAD(P) transhydrogenase subunit alpha PART 2 [Candidatus Endolissoclinum faulkneri L5]|uniref:proton-translocating NAD(P)(+) transhydrogenase n=1 Tax=Candidatus Endolissoclinum faulkneri L5 TaxID=1401328 RepID=V9TRQ2_9PROT|nr:NAD(P) transhydrogenase subunit alpha [Candidatus Endolissoclinum faulkneri]AHC73589.1 NAD(P) transhydrogenase subunit alpha PART 2 [Candidatus Endolissoclinum faulkneri L5]
MSNIPFADKLENLAEEASELALNAANLSGQANTATLHYYSPETSIPILHDSGFSPTVVGLTIFVLACFVGYYVVWRVTPSLHSPLMAITNAISSVIIVGALIAASPDSMNFSSIIGFFAVVLASVNIAGGFLVTERMLTMFKKNLK